MDKCRAVLCGLACDGAVFTLCFLLRFFPIPYTPSSLIIDTHSHVSFLPFTLFSISLICHPLIPASLRQASRRVIGGSKEKHTSTAQHVHFPPPRWLNSLKIILKKNKNYKERNASEHEPHARFSIALDHSSTANFLLRCRRYASPHSRPLHALSSLRRHCPPCSS